MGKIRGTVWQFLKELFGARELSSVAPETITHSVPSNVGEHPQKTVQPFNLKTVQPLNLKKLEDEAPVQFLSEEGISCCNRAIALKPDDYQAWYMRGTIFNNLKQYAEALSNFDRALEINPDFARAWFNRALSLGGLGRNKEATENQNRAFAIGLGNEFFIKVLYE